MGQEEGKEKKQVKHRRMKWVEKVQRKDRAFLHGEHERRKERNRRPTEKQTSQSGRGLEGGSVSFS